MRHAIPARRFQALAVVLAAFIVALSSPARAQYADYVRGANLENARGGKLARASVALAPDGSMAILGCVALPEEYRPQPYLVLWRLRADATLQWSRSWGFNQFSSTLTQVSPVLNVAFAPDGSVVITGSFAGTVDFGGGPLVSRGFDIFLARFDANGNHAWSHSFGSANNDHAYKLLINDQGDITIAGKHAGADFGGGPLDASYGPYDATRLFRATFAPDGAYVSSASFGSSEGTVSINDMVISPGGDVYAIGGTDWTVKFGDKTLDRLGETDIVMLGFDKTGNALTTQRLGGVYYDTGYAIALTPEGDLVTTGTFEGTVSVGGPMIGGGVSFFDMYIARYSADGTHQWSRSNDTSVYGQQVCTAIAPHPAGGFVVTGTLKENVLFDGVSLNARNNDDMLTMRFDDAGSLVFMGKGAAAAKGLAVAAKPGGSTVVVGSNDLDLYFCTGAVMKTPNARGFVAEFSDVPHVDTQAPPVPRPTYDGLTVKWDASIDPDGASVRYRVEELHYFNAIEKVTIQNGTSYPLNAAENPNDYVFVSAFDCFDHESEQSYRVEIHPATYGPLAPDSVRFEGTSLVWTNPTDADVVGVAVDGINYWGSYEPVRLAMTMTPSLDVENLSYSYYRLSALDASGNWSPVTQVADQVPPPAPGGFAYADGNLTWDASKDQGWAAFRVYASKFADFSQEKRLLVVTRKTELVVPIEQRDAYYHLVQYDASGNTSPPVTVEGPGGARPAPPRAVAYRDGRLSWKPTDDTDIDHYDIYASASEASSSKERKLVGSTSALEFAVTEPDYLWYYVVAVDVANQSSLETTVSAVTGRAPSFTLSLGVLSNPFRGATTLSYSLPQVGDVKLAIFDVRGALVATLVNTVQPGGSHYAGWSGLYPGGNRAPSGVYFARLQFEHRDARTVKLILLK